MEISNQDKLKLIHFLNFVCDYEASKPLEEMNEELIDSCIDVLLELQDKHVNHSPEFIDEQVRKIFHKEETETTEPESVKPVKKQINKKKVWLVAACIAILVALFSIVSVANDWNVFDFLSEKFGSVHSAPVEEEVDFNGVSVINHGKNAIYSNLEEALTKEKLYVLYPKFLPENIEIIDITFYSENSTDVMMYGFSSPDTSLEIRFKTKLTEASKSDATEIKMINSINCYIYNLSDINCTQITFEYKGNTYIFSHPDEKELIEIIENLEEINNEN